MVWIRLRFVTVATLAVGIATGGAGRSYLRGSQAPTRIDEQPVSNRSTNTAVQAPQPKISKMATDQSETDKSRTMRCTEQLATRKAKVSYEIAKLTRVLANLAIEEYEEVDYPQDLATVEGEIKLAESDLIRAEDRLAWAKRMSDKKYFPHARDVSEELNVKKARFSLDEFRSKRRVLVYYTKTKTIKKLRSEVEKAHSDELARQAFPWEVEGGVQRNRTGGSTPPRDEVTRTDPLAPTPIIPRRPRCARPDGSGAHCGTRRRTACTTMA